MFNISIYNLYRLNFYHLLRMKIIKLYYTEHRYKEFNYCRINKISDESQYMSRSYPVLLYYTYQETSVA